MGHFLQDLVLLLLLCGACALYFEDGFDHHYTYSSESDILGFHNVTTVVKFRIRPVNSSSDGGSLNMLIVDSFVQHSEKGYVADNPMKWNLDRMFLFSIGLDGLVTMVYHQNEDEHEVLSLKKVLASTLSAKVTVQNKPHWHFKSEELDHTGTFEHEYKGEKTSSGLKFVRTHQSSSNVHRFHNKTLHLDHNGTPMHVEAVDNITLHSRDSPSIKRKPMEGEAEIIDEKSGPFPKIATISKSKVKLTAKRAHNEISHHTLTNLTRDTVQVKQKEPEKVPLDSLAAEIKKTVGCIHHFTNKFEKNRTECVNTLRKLLMSIEREEFLQLAKQKLTRTCLKNDTICVDERNLFIDMIGAEGSHDAQQMLVNLVILQPNVTDEDIGRFLIHCITLKEPLQELVEIVEDMCHYGIEYIDGVSSMTTAGKRACLTLGAIAKTLHEINLPESDRIVERLEAWLEPHNQTKTSEIVNTRRPRSVLEYDRASRKHIETKMVLLQSLGNAGKQRSLDHIKSYLEPDVDVSVWRRVAVHSLRHFSCYESAMALLSTAVNDDNEVIRQTAATVFEKHPRSKNITKDQENVVLSKHYTYPAVARVRRNFLDVLWDGIEYTLKVPGIEWGMDIGTEEIGASMGLIIRNILDFKLSLQSSHFLIDIYDSVYAEAHVGLLDLEIDIIKAYVCFKGHIGYELNILKDFGINSKQDLVNIYDTVIDKIVNPVKAAVKSFNDIINLFKSGSITEVFQDMVTTLEKFPNAIGSTTRWLKVLFKLILKADVSAVIDTVKNIIQQFRQLFNDIEQDIGNFYNSVVDTVKSTLPFVGKKIKDAFVLIVEGFQNMVDSPVQAFAIMRRGASHLTTAIAMVGEAKDKIFDACMLFGGRVSEWFNLGSSTLKHAINKIRQAIDSVLESGPATDGTSTPRKGDLRKIVDDVDAIWLEMTNHFEELNDLGSPFVEQFKAVNDIIKGVKMGYNFLKIILDKSASLVQKVFGPKFHPDFPKERRVSKDDGCPPGVWPTTTNGHYDTLGVDLRLDIGKSIPNPVDGIIHVRGKTKMVIQPTDPQFNGTEIVIENIKPVKNIDGNRYKPGEHIGNASRIDLCKQNFIHLSVRETQVEDEPDSEYQYMDPSVFLDDLNPVSMWVQECMDYEFRILGQSFDSGESGGGATSIIDKIKRTVEEKLGSTDGLSDLLESLKGKTKREATETTSVSSILNNFKDSFIDDFLERPDKLFESFQTALFSEDGPSIPNVLEVLNLNSMSVSTLLDNLEDGSDFSTTLLGLVESLAGGMTELPADNPLALSMSFLKRFLASDGTSLTGNVDELATQLIDSPEEKCFLFDGGIAKSLGHLCIAHCNCLGLNCSVALPVGHLVEFIQVGISFNTDKEQLEIDYNGNLFILVSDGEDHEIDVGHKSSDMAATLQGNIQQDEDNFVLHLEAKLCDHLQSSCHQPMEVLSGIRFPSSKPNVSAAEETKCTTDGKTVETSGIITEIFAMSIPVFINSLGDFGQLNEGAISLIERIRELTVLHLMGEPAEGVGEISIEFHDKVDLCFSFNASVPPFEMEFFSVQFNFMVGPVPLSLGFGAGGALGFGTKITFCVLTLKARVVLIPEVGGKVWGDAAVDLGFVRGGIRLIGYILETQFPVTVEMIFAKYPLDIGSRMDMILVPLRLQLKAFAELNLFIKRVTIFEGTIFEYKLPSIKKNIFNKHSLDKDISPPELLPRTINLHDNFGPDTFGFDRDEREIPETCMVRQVMGRPYYDTAFRLDMYAQDSVSDVKLSYAIGTQSGGTNVADWAEMGGYSLLAPAKLPGGIPLYWTVKATNSEGLEATAQCSLNTFDSTLPDGRVEHSYKFSSHPTKLSASIVVFEDSPLDNIHYKAVGFIPGQYGSQFVDWQELNLDQSVDRMDATGYLKKFTVPREGKLTAGILNTQTLSSPEECAESCIRYGTNCVSFDYETHSKTCDFHDVVEGANSYLRLSGTYKNYERLGVGYRTPIEYANLPLTHGTVYFINTKIKNTLGYEAFLVGAGTMVDFTPPEPGPVGQVTQDILRADKCTAAVTQRCLDTTWLENHRIIIDGPGAATVFNSHKPLYDELYTLTNHYISANWDGFHDDQSGIMGYTWAVGRQVCGTDIHDYSDPHGHLSSESFWTNTGFQKGFHLADGSYYVTVQAVNGAELGGSLVTTVCHSIPFIVDTTPPVFKGVTEIIYDEDFDLIAIYYEASDDLSKIAKTEFALGKTKYDAELKAYSIHEAIQRADPFVALEDLGLQEGIPAWIRIRVTNNVDLFTAGHGDEPILIDKSAPISGDVLDGDKLQTDMQYQSDDGRICAQWVNFYDPESGIDRFLWGIGSEPGIDDVVHYKTLSRYDKSACTDAALKHNKTYYSTVFAYNNALNSKPTNSTSDGVLVDITKPLPGHVVDGQTTDVEDMRFTSETVTKACYWDGYSDPESDIKQYLVDVYINNALEGTFDVGLKKHFEDRTLSLEHNDHVYFSVHGINGAGLSAVADSDGFTVDHTPPIMTEISDSDNNLPYQSDNTMLYLRWNFRDDESGIAEYRTLIYETKHGVKQKIWPQSSPYNVSVPESEIARRMYVILEGLALQDGGKYSLHVTAQNGALMTTAHESVGVIVDTTAPNTPKVHIGLMTEEENLDDNGQVLHSDQHGIRVSWSGRDSESGIQYFLVAVGTVDNPEHLLTFSNYGTDTSAYINNIYFLTSQESNTTYVVSVTAVNGAGLSSRIGRSHSIYIQKANVPGIVFDGRLLYEDEIYTFDSTSLAASFSGFESESCNINSYEWAVGTEPYGTDVFTYTNYGIVMENETHGYMETQRKLGEDKTYFVTVRAVTGCRDEYILSSSNGITLDTIPPSVTFVEELGNDLTIWFHNDVWYQDTTDSISVRAEILESHELSYTEWSLGTVPFSTDLHNNTNDLSHLTNVITLAPGESTFITAAVSDKAGNINNSYSAAIVGDLSPPQITNLSCTKCISARRGLVTCKWDGAVEHESGLSDIFISIGVEPELGNIVFEYRQPLTKRQFSKELSPSVDQFSNYSAFYIDFKVINVVGRTNEYEHKVIIDRTPPKIQGVHVVTRTNKHQPVTPVKCQLPTSFVEINVDNMDDAESGIDKNRFEIALGSNALAADIAEYRTVKLASNELFFIGDLNIPKGKPFYTTVKIYNKAGLYTEMASDAVVVSQNPVLEVLDGESDQDIDFQPVPNIIEGRWKYSDACPILEAKWKVHDLLGNVIKDYEIIPDAVNMFYNDEVKLEAGIKYFVTVETTDALNRTKISRSDGVTVRVQPPLIGRVRDGKNEDIAYQYSVNELSANWDEFGDSSGDPTQSIIYYNVAVGNNPRYESSRSNVYYFVNVGLNTSHTFENLNLTARDITYYITVRAYSVAGGIAESYSNGIRVGYSEEIIKGSIESDLFQSSTERISLSWSGFHSDLGILKYFIGIRRQGTVVTNSTQSCSNLESVKSVFDIKPFEDVGLDTYVTLEHLNLTHGSSYYPSVIAEDASGICCIVNGQSITVDTTPPSLGNIYINDIRADQRMFAKSSSDLHVRWDSFNDIESGIKYVTTTLLDCSSCDANSSEICFMIAEIVSENDTNADFYELDLVSKNNYKVKLAITNKAGLSATTYSHTVLLDESPPNAGVVKITDDWKFTKDFQFSKTELFGKLAVALSEDTYICSSQVTYFPTINLHNWELLDATFTNDFLVLNKTGAFLGIGYKDLATFIKSGISSPICSLQNGDYSFFLRAASGLNTVTTVALASTTKAIPYLLHNKPFETVFSESVFDNITALKAVQNELSGNNSSSSNTTTESPSVTIKQTNASSESNTSLSEHDFGFGFHILGYKIENNENYHGLMWAVTEVSTVERWFKVEFDPTKTEHMFTFSLKRYLSYEDVVTDLSLYVDSKEVIIVDNLKLGDKIRLSLLTWNENGYEAPVEDVFNPFYGEAVIRQINIPEENETECRTGKAFFDGESGIKEIWTGVSDSKSSLDNIAPFQLMHRFCPPCHDVCNNTCTGEVCTDDKITKEYTVLDLNVTSLQLQEASLNRDCFNTTLEDSCNSTSYYLTAKVVNFAGQATVAHSNAIEIDTTPPSCEYMKCLDPDNSGDEPTTHLGSISTIGSYWNCSEDIGIIKYFEVSVESPDDQEVLMKPTNVGTRRRVSFNLGNNTFKDKHNYMVHMTVINNAGLFNMYNCTVKASLLPPNVSTTLSKPLYSVQSAVQEELSLTDAQDKIGISWENGTDEIEYYEWQLGTYYEGADVFPPVKIGINSSGSVAIVQGKLELNSLQTDKKVSEFHEQVIDSVGNINSGPTNTFKQDDFFSMEPGRCVYQTLYAIGWSHLRTNMKSNTVCVKRPQDIVVEKNSIMSTQVIYKPKASSTWTDSLSSSPEIVITSDISDGALMAGSIQTSDKMASYGSAATSDFKSYISDPTLTGSQTRRNLVNRIQQFCDVSFYLAPVPVLQYNNIDINITVPDACKGNTDVQPALISWNPDNEQWQHVEEGCSPDLTARGTDDVYTASICSKSTNSSLNVVRRSTANEFGSPTHYELVTISKTFKNNPPNITTNGIYADEDTFISVPIEVFDLEGDALMFEISGSPQHATCSISSTGLLNCTLDTDFYGNDQITINVTEVGISQYDESNSVEKVIPLYISAVADPVERFFVVPSGEVFYETRPSMRQTFRTDANMSTTFVAGTIALGCIDDGEIFTYDDVIRFTALGDSTYAIDEIPMSDILANNLTLSQYRTVRAYRVTFTYSALESGLMTLYFIAVRGDGTYTPSITVNLYILKNPCTYGTCSHKTHGVAGCDSLARATSYEDFLCICAIGFTGEWCETEINECAPEPCGTLYDCEDLINDYACVINVPKVLAIVICSLLLVAGMTFLTIRLIKKYKKKREDGGQRRILLVSENQQETEPPFIRKPIFREYTDNEIPPFSFFTAKHDKPPFLIGGSWLKHAFPKADDSEPGVSQTHLPTPVPENEELPLPLQSFGHPNAGENIEDATKSDSQTRSDLSDLPEPHTEDQATTESLDRFINPMSNEAKSIDMPGSYRPSLKLSTILGSNQGKEGLSHYLTRQGKAKSKNTKPPKTAHGSEANINLSSLQMFGVGRKGPAHQHLKNIVQQIKKSERADTSSLEPRSSIPNVGLSSFGPRNKGPTHQKASAVKPGVKEINVTKLGVSEDEESHFDTSLELDRPASIASNERPSSQMTDIDT